MTNERMLKLLLLEEYRKYTKPSNFDWSKFNKQLHELREEFLSQYVIDNTPSGE